MTTLSEYLDLIQRAKRVKYKNHIPVLKEKNQTNSESIRGFQGRLDNWIKNLVEFEKQKI